MAKNTVNSTVSKFNLPSCHEQARIRTAEELEGLPYVVIRTRSAGVFAGYLAEVRTDTAGATVATMYNVRRIWFWAGAASCSQLAMEGTKEPNRCTFPCEVGRVDAYEVAEIDYVTEEAKKSIDSVPVWAAKDK